MRTSSPSPGARLLAWHALQRWGRGGVFAETLVASAAAEHHLSHADRALLQALVYGTLRRMAWLDWMRRQLRREPLEDSVRWLVLLGLCQLFVLGQAEYAAVSETVRLAPPRVRGLVNAMLRNALRRRGEFAAAEAELPLAQRFSTPRWLVERWLSDFGEEDTLGMLAWNQQTPPIYLRLNPLDPPTAIPEDWEPLAELPGWYRLHGVLPQEELRAGRVYITDPSTRYSVELLAPRAGERILDACAAPGGKSAAILTATGGQIELLATDAEPHRLPALRDNLSRVAGEAKLRVEQHDWSRPCPSEWQGAFDAVLLDVPCSNSGVLQRRVDVRWRLTPAELDRLAALQASLLEQGARAVRPGGRLVYSTCSIDRQEDADCVRAFLSTHPEFILRREILALPHRVQADGAYAALLERRADGV
ncbi:MAG: RsmB/NOP family class I SAM-dependent RNA methyltransferase [Akkermansia sp.]